MLESGGLLGPTDIGVECFFSEFQKFICFLLGFCAFLKFDPIKSQVMCGIPGNLA